MRYSKCDAKDSEVVAIPFRIRAVGGANPTNATHI
jgi:hypothetical protein